MPRDILDEFGPDSRKPQAGRASHGGVMPVQPCSYSPPQGPSNINDPQGPGLHGGNHGISNCFYPDADDRGSGRPGIGGTNKGNRGTQR